MVTATRPQRRKIRMLSRDQWMALVDRAARRELGVSGEEFVRKLRAGEYGDPDDNPTVMRVASLVPRGW